jgi:hypothetical protein
VTTHPREELGAYVLDALEPDEADAVRAHLATCADCRAEHERLAGLPRLLDLADARATEPEPPVALEAAVLATYGPRPRRQWWRPALAGALAGAAATLLLMALLSGGNGSREVILRGAGAIGTARLTAVDGGTRVQLRTEGLAPTRGDEVYELWFGGENQRVSAGTFAVGADGVTEVTLTCGAPPPVPGRLGITREPDTRDPAGNGPAVLRASL